MYKEEVELDEDADKSLKKKADASGISLSILKKVFDRGVAAWKGGHRPGTTPVQWAHARVNSFISGGKTRTTGDADLWKQHKGKSEEVEITDALIEGMKMNDPKLLRVFDKLKKGSTVKIKHDSSIEKGKDFIEYIVKSKNMVRKGTVEKITMARKDSPTSAKRYLYKRDGKVTMAFGDMAVSPVDIKEEPEKKMDKPDSAKAVDQARDDKKKTRIAQLQLQIAKATETINKLNTQEKPDA